MVRRESNTRWRGSSPCSLLPELDETEDLLGLLALAQIGVGVAEGAAAGVLGEEGQHAGLGAAAGADEVALDLGIVAVVRHRVEVQVERGGIEQVVLG